jgi:hypothetical protein
MTTMRAMLILAIVARAGCTPTMRVVRMGRQLPPRGAGCAVPRLNIDVQTVGLSFETLGSIFVAAELPLDARAQRELSDAACELGGDFVVPSLSVQGQSAFFVVKPRSGVAVRDGRVVGRADPALAGGAAAPRRGAIVAVSPLDDRAGVLTSTEREELTGYFATRLAGSGRYRVVPGESVKARLRDGKRESYRDCYDARCQIELGRALAAEKLVALRLIKIGGACSLTANLYDLKSEAAEGSATADLACSSVAARTGLDSLAAKLGLQ